MNFPTPINKKLLLCCFDKDQNSYRSNEYYESIDQAIQAVEKLMIKFKINAGSFEIYNILIDGKLKICKSGEYGKL